MFLDGTTEFENATLVNKQYSVNYNQGMVYLSHPYGDTSISCSYSHTTYEALYRIARKINPKGYEVDIHNKQITIKDSEFFKYLEVPSTTQSGKAAYYLINYDYVKETRENVEELKDYFTPVVKEYILKFLKKGIIGALP